VVACAVAAVLTRRSGSTDAREAFLPLDARAGAAAAALTAAVATLGAAPPSLAEETSSSLVGLEAKLNFRKQGIERTVQEPSKKKLPLQEFERIEREELEMAKRKEKEEIIELQKEEQQAKEAASKNERVQREIIAREEKAAQQKAKKELDAKIAQIKAIEKTDIEAAKTIEKAEKQAARDVERREKRSARNEAQRLAAEDQAEAAINAATEKSENAIIGARDKAENAVLQAVDASEAAILKATQRAEQLQEVALIREEVAFKEATEFAEKAEIKSMEQEQEVERAVTQAVDGAEKGELLEENASLKRVQDILFQVVSVIVSAVGPGVLILVSAFFVSLFSSQPEKCYGAEEEEIRTKMGRKPRGRSTVATLDPWEDDALSRESEKEAVRAAAAAPASRAAVGAALVVAFQMLPESSPSFALTSQGTHGSAARSPRVPAMAAQVTSPAFAAGLYDGGSVGSVKAAAGAAAAVLAISALARTRSGNKMLGVSSNRSASRRRGAKSILATKQNTPAITALRARDLAVTEENPLKVVIAGGGVGGLLAAKALSTLPTVDVTILEQTSKFARFGGPIQLASNALSVIRQIDEELFEKLMERFTFTGSRRNGLVDALRTEWYCSFDAMKGSADYFSLPYTGVVDRPDLQEILMDSIPKGCLKNSRKVAGYEVLPNFEGVRVRTEDGEISDCDVLIGGDGIWSATRAQMWGQDQKGPGSGCTYSGYIVFAGEAVYRPQDYFDVGYKVYMGPKQYFVTSDVGRGRIQWYAFVGVPEGQEIPEESSEKKDYIRATFTGWSQQILDLIDATPAGCVEDRALYDRPPSLLKSWADGPVALMGDACHPMMPNLGQGGCQAMEDAYALMERLGQVTHRSQVPDKLQDYYRFRIVRSAAIQGLSRIASDLLLSTFCFPWKPSEGFSAPYGRGRGDFNYDAVLVNSLKYLLPAIFTAQFTFLYSYHPHVWTPGEVQDIVKQVMDRHRKKALEAWDNRMDLVEKGEHDKSDANVASFFKLDASTLRA